MRIYSHKQLLLCDGKKEIYCHRGKLYVKNAYEKRETVINVIPRSYIYRLFSKISLLERMFRLSTRCAAWIDEDTFIFAQRRHIFKVSISKKNIEIEHSFQVGMNAPIKFCNIAGLPGFSDGILYGTYTGARGHVSIWQRDIWGCWSEKYRFPENRVLHIHNIVPDYKNKRLLILTGDLDTESGIWEAKNNFSEVNLLLGGKQQYRACVAFVEDNHILFATDTPLEDNFLYDFDESTHAISPICQLPGPVIYGAAIKKKEGTRYLLSTSVEPDSRIKGMKYLLTRKVGEGVKSRESHVFYGNKEEGFREIGKFQKDLWPMGFFQFGNVFFPLGERERLLVCPSAVKKYSGKTVEVYL